MILVFLALLIVMVLLLCRCRVPEMFRNLQSPTSADLYMIPPAGMTDPHSHLGIVNSPELNTFTHIYTSYTYVHILF